MKAAETLKSTGWVLDAGMSGNGVEVFRHSSTNNMFFIEHGKISILSEHLMVLTNLGDANTVDPLTIIGATTSGLGYMGSTRTRNSFVWAEGIR